MKLTVVTGEAPPVESVPSDVETVTRRDLKRWVLRGELLARVGRYERGTYRVPYLEAAPTPAATATLLRLLSRGACHIEDDEGRRRAVTWGTVAGMGAGALRDFAMRRPVVAAIERDVAVRAQAVRARKERPALDLAGRAVYLRTDLWYGIKSGGSVGHTAGVLNNLDAFTGPALFLTTSRIPTVREDIETKVVEPGARFWNVPEVPLLDFTDVFLRRAGPHIPGDTGFVYQRYSLNNYAGVVAADRRRVPFVLEYNGSEVWINRHWGQPLRYERLSVAIEDLNLAAADLVVVVSAPMRDELVARGVDAGKILVNPNGVDPDVYSPAVDGSAVRTRYGLGDDVVVGFIGTFGPWHGAEVLAEAFGRLVGRRPELRSRIRLLMIGDGARMPQVREAIDRHGIADRCVLTGLVPQHEGPAHLAACDVLASPHVPNPDGTPFFGSPTKLFEYMAMGRGIVASALDQIADVLEDGATAVLVEPGNVDAFAAGLETAVTDAALRARLGGAAREEALRRYTWRDHTGRIVDALRGVCG